MFFALTPNLDGATTNQTRGAKNAKVKYSDFIKFLESYLVFMSLPQLWLLLFVHFDSL